MKRARVWVGLLVLLLGCGGSGPEEEGSSSAELGRSCTTAGCTWTLDPPAAGEDAAPLLRAALAEASRTSGLRSVVLRAGRYALESTTSTKRSDAFDPSRGVTMRTHLELTQSAPGELRLVGEPGATLAFSDVTALGVLVHDAQDVTVEGLAALYDPLPFTQGVLSQVSAESHQAWFRVDPGYPDPLDPTPDAYGPGVSAAAYFGVDSSLPAGPDREFLYAFSDDAQRWERAASNLLQVVGPLAKEALGIRVPLVKSEPLDGLEVGRLVALVPRVGKHLFNVYSTERLTLRDVRVFSAPLFVLIQRSGGQVIVEGMSIVREPGSSNLLSSNADGLHFHNGLQGPVIRGLTCQHAGDDCVAVNPESSEIVRRTSARSIEVEPATMQELAVGHLVRFHDASTRLLSSARVVGLGGREVQLDGDVPDGAATATDANAVLDGWSVTDSFLGFGRARGLIAGAPNGLVRNNRFRATQSSAILLQNGLGLGLRHVTKPGRVVIEGNSFERMMNAPAIHASLMQENSVGIRDVQVTGNRFDGVTPTAPAVIADNADGLTVYGNELRLAAAVQAAEPGITGAWRARHQVTQWPGAFVVTGRARCTAVAGNALPAGVQQVIELRPQPCSVP